MPMQFVTIDNEEFIKIRKKIVNSDYLSGYTITDSVLFNRNRIYIFNSFIIKVFYKIYI